MKAALAIFHENTARVRSLGGLHGALSRLTTNAIDSSDLLRAQIVLTVSALDFFVHEITVRGTLEILKGVRPASPGFMRQKVSGSLILGPAANSLVRFEEDLRQRHSILSFQQPDKIADAVRLFSEKQLWKEVGIKLSQPEETIKNQLTLIVGRRNKIAHEADIDPTYGTRWPIATTDATLTLTFIESVCLAIYDIVS